MEKSKKPKKKEPDGCLLRDAAEAKLARSNGTSPEMKEKTPEEILYELQVHQFELEMQNEELHCAQAELEATRARYFDLYDLAPVGYITLNEKGLILEANLTAATLLGMERSALVNQLLSRFVLPEDQDLYYLNRKQLMEIHPAGSGQGDPAQVWEMRLMKSGTTPFWGRMEATLAQDLSPNSGQGCDGGVVVRLVMSDITKRKQAEDDLRKSEEYFKAIIQNSSDIILILDKLGIITYVSPSIERFLGYRSDELIGKRTLDLIVSDDKPRAIADFGRALLIKEVPIPNVFRIRHKNGTERILEGIGKNLLDNPSIAGFVMNVHDITERKQAEEALKKSEENYKQIVENSRDLIYTLSPEGEILFMSRAVFHLLGYDQAALVGRPFQTILHPDDLTAWEENFKIFLEKSIRSPGFRYRVKHVSGEWRWHSSSANAVVDKQGNFLHVQAVARDITDYVKLEEQFIQAQKMESIGRLASGVAHDFNNLLTTIIGNAQLALLELDKDGALYEIIKEITKAGEKGANLIRQLLAFSRKQNLHLEVVNVNEAISDLENILRRLISEDIEMKTVLAPDLGTVEVDLSQIEQVIINLVVNARDALPRGGRLIIETANAELDQKYSIHFAVTPGSYVMVSVSDTGIGMSSDIQTKVFDPFFTTKKAGEGTGLGLSTVYGIVKQSRGYIWVYSEVGQGTTIKIYLPRVDQSAVREEGKRIKEEVWGGSETVLIAEDDENLRHLTGTLLKRYGYNVLEAGDGLEALDRFKGSDRPIHLLIADVVMPGMNGKELADRLGVLCPELKVLFMSGYSDKAVVDQGILDKGKAFIEKPFNLEDLVSKVREVLDA